MKSVLISIQPKWCSLIASGEKTVEVRKTKPKLEAPFKCYIYATKSGDRLVLKNDKVFEMSKAITGKVIGEFVCNKVDRMVHCGTCNSDIRLRIVDENLCYKELDYAYFTKLKLHYPEIDEYSSGGDVYGWHISDLVIYDKPRELSEFQKPCIRDSGCSGCEYAFWTYDYGFEGCMLEWGLQRPPQSWCYVEE